MTMLHRLASLVLLALIVAVAAEPAAAETLYETGFEQPTFSPGLLDGQDGFVGTFGAGAASISTTSPRSGSQSVEVAGALLEDFGGFFFGEYDREIGFDSSPGRSRVDIFADVRLDGPLTTDDLLSVNFAAFTPEADTLGDFSISSTGAINGLTDPFAGTVLTTAGALSTYFTLRMSIDFEARTTSFFVDGVSLGTLDIAPAVTSDSLGFIGLAMVSVASQGETASYTGFFDNVRVQVAVIPEPRSLAMTALGFVGLAAIAGKRRRR